MFDRNFQASPGLPVPQAMPTRAGRPVSGSVRFGAALIAFGTLQFTAAMIVVQLRFPGYSDLANYISDLGNSSISPWFPVFNISIIVLGICAFVGILLAWPAFPKGGTRPVGLSLLLLAGVGAILVGLFPENVNLPVHEIASLLVFAPGGVALVVLAAGMRPRSGWERLGLPSAVLGLVTLVALAYYVPTQQSGTTWYPGLVERLIVAPILIWAILAAIQLIGNRSRWSVPPGRPEA